MKAAPLWAVYPPASALGSLPSVALSSGQAIISLVSSGLPLEASMTTCYRHEDISKESKPRTFLKSSDKPYTYS
jgi:hypothetical protein